ncbi:lambda exonuclease family protein [Roseibacillus ishigakijimensis]|uniref:YqaJ viral recombinase family protein n=1 Tax=Roseibacillus ishigakijimensis TaxID=454146 RepID=A0A934RSC2_9BACT|nr:lambda exonuclease family protein [Roseibacillus ishigakijimensis]MBK1835032.1 YqaJ viral recombinase family protein [Roseibacillus ishigakijimensis]
MKPLEDRIWPIEQGQENWFRARAGRPTASQFSRIITAKGADAGDWRSFAAELVLESYKAGKGLSPEGSFQGNRHTERGNVLEPLAREAFAEKMAKVGVEVIEVGFVTGQDDWAGCSPDALVKNASGEFVAGLEIKCPDNGAFAHTIAHGLPDSYIQQVHGGMAITGLDYWYFATFQPNVPIQTKRIERDGYTAKLEDALGRFADYYLSVYPELYAAISGEEVSA